MEKGSHKVLVPRFSIKTKGLYPSSLELYDQFKLLNCYQAVEKWHESWSFCPVCLARYEADGSIKHLERPTH